MSYPNPYANYYGQGPSRQHHYHDSTTNFNPYPANGDEAYQSTARNPDNPFNTNHEISYPPKQQGNNVDSVQGLTVEPLRRHDSGFDQGEFTPHQEKTLPGLKNYRYEHRGKLWTKGGRGHCIWRFCCFTLMTTVFLVVSILLTLALWIRPPNVSVGNVDLASSKPLQINEEQKELTINLNVNISVSNPNYFAINFQKIQADIIYPINNTHIGGGELKDVVFRSNQQTNITFPFSINYIASNDPGYHVLLDLSQKCGVSAGARKDISVNYKITLGLRALFFVASPVVSNSMSFACPASAQQIEDFLRGLGISNLLPTTG